MQNLNIAFFQAALVWEDTDRNLHNFELKINNLQKRPDLIILPEMFTTGFTMNPERCAEEANGKTMNWLLKQAKDSCCTITGSLIVEEGGKYFNRLVWMNADGSFSIYDKRHLFRFSHEHEHYTAGNERLITHVKGWKIRPLICYDLRFPVWSKNTWNNGVFEYDLILYIANWPEVRRHPWRALLIARAMENLCFVVGVNRVGPDGRDIAHSGDSMIVDARGHIIKDTKEFEEETVLFTLDASDLTTTRERFNVGQDWDNFEIKD